jgi:hypothetical protein
VKCEQFRLCEEGIGPALMVGSTFPEAGTLFLLAQERSTSQFVQKFSIVDFFG